MRQRVAVAVLLLCGGCYLDRAVVDPWSEAPRSQRTYWRPSRKASLKQIKPPDSVVPTQTEDLSLAELIDIGLSNNTQTQLTWAQARAAAAQYGQTQSSDLPDLTGNFNYQRQRASSLSTTFTPGPLAAIENGGQPFVNQYFLTTFGPQLSLTYTLLDFGQQRLTTEAARYSLYFADWTHNRQIQTVMNTITDDYYNLVYEQQLQLAYAANVETAQTTFDAANLGLQMGVKDVSDMLQAKTQLLQRKTQYASEQSFVQTAYATLLNDMGLSSQLSFTVVPIPTEIPPEEVIRSVDELIGAALESRPDLLAAAASLQSKEDTLRAAKREYWPTVNFTFDLGRTYYGSNLHDKYDFTTLFALNFPIFNGFYYRNGIKIAEANREQSEANLRTIQLEISKQISTAHYNIKISYETLVFAEETLKSAEKEYEVLLHKYKSGTTSIVDLLSAQSSLADARAAKVNALKQWYTALATLAYATGMLDIQPGETL